MTKGQINNLYTKKKKIICFLKGEKEKKIKKKGGQF
jgi:hypothetical protein